MVTSGSLVINVIKKLELPFKCNSVSNYGSYAAYCKKQMIAQRFEWCAPYRNFWKRLRKTKKRLTSVRNMPRGTLIPLRWACQNIFSHTKISTWWGVYLNTILCVSVYVDLNVCLYGLHMLHTMFVYKIRCSFFWSLWLLSKIVAQNTFSFPGLWTAVGDIQSPCGTFGFPPEESQNGICFRQHHPGSKSSVVPLQYLNA